MDRRGGRSGKGAKTAAADGRPGRAQLSHRAARAACAAHLSHAGPQVRYPAGPAPPKGVMRPARPISTGPNQCTGCSAAQGVHAEDRKAQQGLSMREGRSRCRFRLKETRCDPGSRVLVACCQSRASRAKSRFKLAKVWRGGQWVVGRLSTFDTTTTNLLSIACNFEMNFSRSNVLQNQNFKKKEKKEKIEKFEKRINVIGVIVEEDRRTSETHWCAGCVRITQSGAKPRSGPPL